jgi:hypothetical protein
MEEIDFVKSLDKDGIYIVGFSKTWSMDQIKEFFEITRGLGLQIMGVYSDGFTLMEPIGVDKEKLRELLK